MIKRKKKGITLPNIDHVNKKAHPGDLLSRHG
jgi:hypothetical protein